MKDEPLKICFASNLTRLRKKMGLTQEALAAQLYVSGKAISKWERGLGYPETTQLLRLARFFGVSVDRLLRDNRNGIAIAGNILADQVKLIDSYPERQMLSNIRSVSRAVGGCVPNTAINLAKMDRSIPISAIGKVGRDESGDFVLREMRAYGIDTDQVLISDRTPTSFSDVMTLQSTGERTFFHFRGANAEFSPEEIIPSDLNCRMFHIGYILLLDLFDKEDAEYGTAMARFLDNVQKSGVTTSIDVVSSDGGLFREKVLPALKYTDNAFMNEIEGCAAAGLSPRDANGKLIPENIRKAMQFLLSAGVRERVILHCPEAGFLLNRKGELTVVPSLDLPKGFIKGSVGAGDAFTAGCLYGIYHGCGDREILEIASGAAVCNLSAEDSVSGMKSVAEIREMISRMPRQPLPKI